MQSRRSRSVSRGRRDGKQTFSSSSQVIRPKTAQNTKRKVVESKADSQPPRRLSSSPAAIVEGKSLHGSSNKSKKVATAMDQTSKSPVQIRSRSSSRPRSSMQRSNNSNKPDNNASSSDFDSKALEEMKKKEEEQMALIKNMRRRQEAALREAEGERERAKAWAAAEKESVKKWVEEQRALIRKDRHKAANAALLATRKASRGNKDEDNDVNDDEENLMKAELEKMRMEMKKIKVEAVEASRLREQVRKQERMINALKQGGDATTENNTCQRRVVLGDRTSKENMQQGSKVMMRENTSKNQAMKAGVSLNQDPTDGENNYIEDEEALPQRKPYNAADYDGKTQAHSIPQFVSAPTPPGQGGARASQIVTYQNGTTKEVLPDGTTTISFANGDRKRTYANEKKGIEVYYYAATKVSGVYCLFFDSM